MFKSSFRDRVLLWNPKANCLRDLGSGRDSAVEGRRTTGMSNALDEVDFDYATTIADRANRFMSLHGVPPTPENFSVWFDYAMGASPALRKTIDILIANKRKFDSAINRDLYVTYINPSSGRRRHRGISRAVAGRDLQRQGIPQDGNFRQSHADRGARRSHLAISGGQRSPADHRKAGERSCQMRRRGPQAWRRISSRHRKNWTRFATR